MASIHGIELKKLETKKDLDGYKVYSGSLYIGGKKIAVWEQDMLGGSVDTIRMEPGFSERMLRKALKRLHPEKVETYTGYAFEYNLEYLLSKLISLKEAEKLFRKYLRDGSDTMLEVDDGFRCVSCGVIASSSELEAMKDFFRQDVISGYGLADTPDTKVTAYRSLEDFQVGKPILLCDITVQREREEEI